MRENKLKPPVSYQGGKQKISKYIVDRILQPDTNYIDLCCGSGAVSIELINRGVHPEDITMVDASDWGNFWWQVSNDCFDMDYFEDLIDSVPEDRDEIKPFLELYSKGGYDTEDGIDTIPVWLLLQAGSFGGKQIYTKDGKFCNASFRSYWKPTETSSRRSPVNPMMPMPNTLLSNTRGVVECMSPIKASHSLVEDFNWRYYDKFIRTEGTVVVFIDPPYDNTQGYSVGLDYTQWLLDMKSVLPSNYQLWITDYKPHSENYYVLSNTNKGGISGGSTKRQEILSKVI